MEKTIYELALKQMKDDDISFYKSDLFLRVNAISQKLVENYKWKQCVKTFKCFENKTWYDIPFGFDPYWDHAIKGY